MYHLGLAENQHMNFQMIALSVVKKGMDPPNKVGLDRRQLAEYEEKFFNKYKTEKPNI